MSLPYLQRIQSVKNQLTQQIKPNDVAYKLWAQGVLTKREKDRLLQLQVREGNQSHNASLFEVLQTKPESLNVWEKLVAVLEDTGNKKAAHTIQHDIGDDGKLKYCYYVVLLSS